MSRLRRQRKSSIFELLTAEKKQNDGDRSAGGGEARGGRGGRRRGRKKEREGREGRKLEGGGQEQARETVLFSVSRNERKLRVSQVWSITVKFLRDEFDEKDSY